MKNLAKTVLFILFVSFLVACSSETGGNSETLEVALWDENASDAVDASIEAFKEEHPDVEVNVTYTPYEDYWTKLKTSLGGGNAADVFWMNGPRFYEYVTSDLIKNLEPFIEEDSEFTKDGYFSTVIELYSYEEDLYAAPYFVDSVGLFYNKELFDEADVPYPDETWTWEDIEEKGAQLTNPDEGVFGYAAHTVANQQGYYNLIHQAGGFIINEDKTESGFNTPETKEAFYFLENIIEQGISPSTQMQIESEPRQLFMSNKLAMLPSISVNGEMLHNELGDKLGVAPLPAGKEEASIVHGIGWAINEATDQEELAWELVKKLSGEEGNKVIAESGFSMPAYEEMGSIWLESLPSLDLQIFLDAQKDGVAYPISERTAEWQDVEMTEIQAAFLGQQTLDEALEIVADEMNAILEEEQKD